MKHINTISATRAEAFRDFMYAIWRSWYDFRIQKKNEYLI
jgi:hypothetical protein